MKLLTTITPLFRRVIVFIVLFIAISGVIGPLIINGGILFSDGFWIYGGIGKGLIFGLIAFGLLARRHAQPMPIKPWQPTLLWWFAGAAVALVVAGVSIHNLLSGQREPYNLVGAHGGLLLGLSLTAVGCMGPKNIQSLCRGYKIQIRNAAVLAILFYIFLHGVYALWQPLAAIVLMGVTFLLDATGLHATIVPPHTLLFDKFGITIAEFCSGVESIALFTSLYAIVGLLDWQRLNKRRYLAVFPLALLLLFLFNIVRVYGLIMAGYYINAEIAFTLFHTYAGMVFFILYSAIFWMIAYKHLLKKPKHEDSASH
jgi:exosortase/archaeosortase family protein